MHLHIPKVPHSLREFLREVGIIALAVMIALGSEQAIEAMHWRHVIESERESLDLGVDDVRFAMRARVAEQPCVDRRLADLAVVFKRREHHQPLGLVAPIGRVALWLRDDTALRIATADGSLSHMSVAEKNKYFSAFGVYQRTFAPVAQEERDSWRALQPLNHPEVLGDEDWRALRKAYSDALDSNMVLKSNLKNDGPGQWLKPFTFFPNPSSPVDVTAYPQVKLLCADAVTP